MSESEIKFMEESLKYGSNNINETTWQKAFKLYNHDKANKMLGMGCRPCYQKVLTYSVLKATK